ncbi:MAG: hypothetical protein PWP12_504 [Bacillota bacterium]|jgi:uncharacterized YkwD family protein|nr:hypothetical protein [Bacillota bacterium]MDK2883420.1 hypothetical protein [Bacillota bacterium]MDK2960320.1 hypothetical protein [Bacillota bacterium]
MLRKFSALLALVLVLTLCVGLPVQAATVTIRVPAETNYASLYQKIQSELEEQLGGILSSATIAELAKKLAGQLASRLNVDGVSPAPQPAPAPAPNPAPEPEPVSPPSQVSPQPVPEGGLTPDEARMVELVNQERVKAGLKPLVVDMRLVETARAKSRDMIEGSYFGHNSPVLGSPFEQMRRSGISYHYAGENLAGAPTVEQAHAALMKSPGHRANILNPNFTRIGVGIADGGPYGKMFTQQFIG